MYRSRLMGVRSPLSPLSKLYCYALSADKAYVTKYNLDTCLIVIGHRLDTDELYNICHPNMYMKHGL